MTRYCYGCENNILNQEGHNPGCLSPSKFYLYTDGACKGNPGKSGGGAVIYDEDMVEIASTSVYFGIGTNNEAEYKALIEGLKLCQENDIPIDEYLVIRADSQLMVKQINGEYQIKSEKLKPLFDEIQKYSPCSLEHVYRNLNKRADELANKAVIEFKV